MGKLDHFTEATLIPERWLGTIQSRSPEMNYRPITSNTAGRIDFGDFNTTGQSPAQQAPQESNAAAV
jgi:hypothetical protein